MEALTSGRIIGVTDTDGRTILSAGLTMALLILPVIIINAQEAIRAVPQSVREGSYGLGAHTMADDFASGAAGRPAGYPDRL